MGRNCFSFVLLLILGIVRIIRVSGSCDYLNRNKSTVSQLKSHLFCQYDSDVRPVYNTDNVTRVNLRIIPKFFEYVQETEIFELHTWISMFWSDAHLTWDPAKFDNIKYIYISAYAIWTPDIILHNNKYMDEDTVGYMPDKCWVIHKGFIHYWVPTKFSTYCIADNTWWPYNTVNCSIQLGSWSYTDKEIDPKIFHDKGFDINRHQYKENVEWDVLKIYTTNWTEKYKYNTNYTTKMFSTHYILRRNWSIIRIAFVTPSIVLMIMTLTTLWLEPKSFERMIIANLNFLCHILCIQDVHWEMPKSGINVPKMLIFYERSLAIALFTLILTNILRQLEELTSNPPIWISATTKLILRSRVGQILLVSILDPAVSAKIEIDADDNTDLVQSSTKKSPWRYVTVLIGWVAFFGTVFAYIILLGTCFPTYYNVTF